MFIETPVTLILLLVNGLVGAYTLFVDPSLVGRLAFRPYAFLRQREWWRALTAGFVHAGMGHLAVNLLTLYFFGPYVEQLLGPAGFLAVYFGSELAANLATLLRHRENPGYSAVGASGAISGVLFSFCLFAPLQLLYLFFAIPIPALLFAVLYVGYSVYAARQQADRIAHEAHLGGAIGGVLITLLVRPDALGIFLRQLGL